METLPIEWDFVGRRPAALDDQDRFSIPKAWREEVGSAGHKKMIAFPVVERNANKEKLFTRLVIYPLDVENRIRTELDREARRLGGRQGKMMLMRLMRDRNNAAYVTWDKNGRTKIDPSILAASGISAGEKSPVLIVGSGEVIEVWKPEEFEASEAYLDDMAQEFDSPMGTGLFGDMGVGTDNMDVSTEGEGA